MRIVFAWWNTSLSPLGKRQSTIEHKKIAFAVLEDLIVTYGVDCLALGEITIHDIAEFLEQSGVLGYEFFDGTERRGRLQFDTGVLYRSDVLLFHESKILDDGVAGGKLKIGNHIHFRITKSNESLHVIVSHWPSRLWRQQNGAERNVLGVRLRDYVDKFFPANDATRAPKNEIVPKVILLGDYNDEPFDQPLAEQLKATRDRRRVQRNPMLFYNPFWRHLGESKPYINGDVYRGCAGSYFYSSVYPTCWHTFDQIIFSSAFLGGS
jgi:hypothetical protein